MYELSVTASDGKKLRALHGDWLETNPFLTLILPFGLRVDAARTLCSLLASEFNVVTWQGRSLCDQPPGPHESGLTPEAHVRDMCSVLDALGVRKTGVVGFCSGAGIALVAATIEGSRIDRLALVCGEYMLSPAVCPQSNFQREVDSLLPLAAEGINYAAALCEKLAASRVRASSRTEFDDEVRMPFSSAARLYRHGLNYLSYRGTDFMALAGGVPHPTRLISTDRDEQVSAASSQVIAALLRNAEQHLVVPGDHYEILRGRNAVNDSIVEFFGGRGAA
ncbi:alpha/beta fold hydrolase [Burkholderia sp. MSMB1835]|uniref:alpha/beta fold hydrolase n=1 Tax=Burkholderia sp. MSMB1835 TaxID=1637876 RepID=UPI000758BF2A|nr:alpha/beta hydrolase [Burkholderia sp. MSMB1835]KVL30852.1 alpha/beta hydrolase [Burkholderia sp. MSMB1835]